MQEEWLRVAARRVGDAVDVGLMMSSWRIHTRGKAGAWACIGHHLRTWTEGKRPLKDTAQLCRGEANGQTGTLFRATWETLSTRATGENAAGIRSSLIGSPPFAFVARV